MIDPKLIFLGGGLAGVLAGFWSTIKSWLNQLISALIVTNYIANKELTLQIRRWLWTECKPFQLNDNFYFGDLQYIQPLEKNQIIAARSLPLKTWSLWRFKRKIFWIQTDGNNQNDYIQIRYIRGTFNSDDFIIKMVDDFNNHKKQKTQLNRFFTRVLTGTLGVKDFKRNDSKQHAPDAPAEGTLVTSQIDILDTCKILKWKRNQLGLPVQCGSIELLSLSDEVLNVYKEILYWKDSEQWFKKRKIPWKRGFLFFGVPGTGKTAFVRALGQELDIPIFYFDLSTMSNSDFYENWDKCSSYAPAISLFEDIDGVFNGRKNISCEGTMNKGLTFDCFLNVIDGVNNTDGVLKIITTNDISKIDSALGISSNGNGMSTRPGRIDRIVEFLPLDSKGREKMAKRIFEGFDEKEWSFMLEKGKEDTGAQFQERCCRLALDLFWKMKEK